MLQVHLPDCLGQVEDPDKYSGAPKENPLRELSKQNKPFISTRIIWSMQNVHFSSVSVGKYKIL